jgi:hypothetical protein
VWMSRTIRRDRIVREAIMDRPNFLGSYGRFCPLIGTVHARGSGRPSPAGSFA